MKILAKLHRKELSISASKLTLMCAFFIITFYNFSLWKSALYGHVGDSSTAGLPLIAVLYLALICILATIFSVFSIKYLHKPLLILVFIIAAAAANFMDNYGVMIDKDMIRNVMQTDYNEASDLINGQFLLYMGLLGLLPVYIISRLQIRYRPFIKELFWRIFSGIGLLLFAIILLWSQYQDLSSFVRNNRYLRFMVNPSAPIYYTIRYFQGEGLKGPLVIKPLGTDARKGVLIQKADKKMLAVVVVGETARAESFSLNGYKRDTNPELSKMSKQELANFSNFSSCGTSTAVSLPCMFSIYTRSEFGYDKAESSENLVDVLKHAGFNLLWRENNTGSKGIADRIQEIEVSTLGDKKSCEGNECRDSALLYKLQNYIDQQHSDTVIFLHQNGNHGPAYYKRVPKSFEKFEPLCRSTSFKNCSRQEVINAYDNAILYTDTQLANVIKLLKKNNNRFNTMMLYLSDHGESTGENGLYLHGTPYLIAPSQQTHIPFITWFSSGYQQAMGLNMQCVDELLNKPYSQDNLFHTVLGLTDTQTKVYQPKMDIFQACRS